MEEKLQEICKEFQAVFEGKDAFGYRIAAGPENLYELMDNLFRGNYFLFDFLKSISAEHITGTAEAIVLHYHLGSITNAENIHVSCRRELEDADSLPVFPSVCSIWHAAGWHEREAAELFGIRFENHPDLRKLLLPTDWEGFPMRKNYSPAESYHGLKINITEKKTG